MVILAVPDGAIDEAIAQLGEGIAGKTLVDVTNALTGDMKLARRRLHRHRIDGWNRLARAFRTVTGAC